MAADITARRVRLANNLFLIVFLIFTGCSAPDKPVQASNELINRTEQNLSIVNGILLVNGEPFNGTLFSLFPGTTDTIETSAYQNGKEHGEWKQFYPTRQLKETRFFENGQKTGEYTTWWENGNIQLKYLFANDEYEGTCREWSENGLLNKEMNYNKGHEEGRQQWWYDNGKIKANYIIKNGRRYGLLGTKNCTNVSDSIFKN